jgi:hypothetical protein
MRRTLWTVAALCGLVIPSLALGQTTNRERARNVLAPDVLRAVEALADAAERDGLPSDPVYAKALEGVAKGVPEARLLPALDQFAGRLRVARDVLGAAAQAPLLVAGVDALARGVPTETLRGLAAAERRPVAIVVLGDLVQSGLPADAALEVVREALARRAPDEALLDIPPAARRLLRDAGSTDAALDALRRRIRDGGGRVGPPAPPGSEPLDRDRRRGDPDPRAGGGG